MVAEAAGQRRGDAERGSDHRSRWLEPHRLKTLLSLKSVQDWKHAGKVKGLKTDQPRSVLVKEKLMGQSWQHR